MTEETAVPSARPMLNAYPDSMGGRLSDVVGLLRRPELNGVFDAFYVLPSMFHSDLDRGFSVIDYGLETALATEADLADLRALGIDLKLDVVLNHCSVASPQFQDLLRHGDASRFRDFFVDWNAFWAGHGEMTPEGYVQPDAALLEHMFFRKPGLPILMVPFPDGREVPFWNTFYQEVVEDAAGRRFLGQMDVDVRSPLVWEFYDETLRTLAGYGAQHRASRRIRLRAQGTRAPQLPQRARDVGPPRPGAAAGGRPRRHSPARDPCDLRRAHARADRRAGVPHLRLLPAGSRARCAGDALRPHARRLGARAAWTRASGPSACSAATTASRCWTSTVSCRGSASRA